MRRFNRSPRGFTLVETLIVLAVIIGIVSVVAALAANSIRRVD